jgi:hypothetical protein
MYKINYLFLGLLLSESVLLLGGPSHSKNNSIHGLEEGVIKTEVKNKNNESKYTYNFFKKVPDKKYPDNFYEQKYIGALVVHKIHKTITFGINNFPQKTEDQKLFKKFVQKIPAWWNPQELSSFLDGIYNYYDEQKEKRKTRRTRSEKSLVRKESMEARQRFEKQQRKSI